MFSWGYYRLCNGLVMGLSPEKDRIDTVTIRILLKVPDDFTTRKN